MYPEAPSGGVNPATDGVDLALLLELGGLTRSHPLVDVVWALAFVVGGFIAAVLVHGGMRWLGQRARESRFRFDGVLVRVLSRPLAILVALFGILRGVQQVGGLSAWLSRWQGVEEALLVLAGTWVVAGLVKQLVEVYGEPRVASTETDFDDRLLGIVDLAATLVIWVVGILLALHTLGIVITPVLASMGVLGLAVALAVRTILSNFFGGLVVTADPTLQTGHRVEVDGWMGDVVDIGRYKTTIRTRENLLVSLPNDQLMRETVVNHNLPASRTRIEMSVSVAYGTDIETVEAILFEIAEGIDGVVEDPVPEANVVALGDHGIEIKVLAWQEGPRGRRETRDALYRQALERFAEEGIEIPYPHLDVALRDERADEDGSAA